MKYKFQIAMVLLATLASCGHEEKKPVAAARAPQYKMMTLTEGRISSTVQLPGVLDAFQFVQLYPKLSGFVKEVHVDRGSVVKAGQSLIRLEAPEIEEHVAEAKLKYMQANAMYLNSKDRYQRLLETSKTPGTIAAYDLSAAQNKMQADAATAQGEQAAYKAQQDMQAYLNVNAPFNGVITERNVHPGALVGPGTQGAKPMLVLQQQSKLRLVVNIPEQYSAQVKNGDVVHFKINAQPGQDFKGTVSRSSGNLSSNFRSETIEVDVPNTDNTFKPGMYAEVVLPVGGSVNAYVVPKSAVVTTTEHKYVIVNNNGDAHMVDVTQGNEHGDSTEVFGALHTGDVVLTNGSYQVKAGDKL
jgi:membrane fusion protein (multidrug efflux system)